MYCMCVRECELYNNARTIFTARHEIRKLNPQILKSFHHLEKNGPHYHTIKGTKLL